MNSDLSAGHPEALDFCDHSQILFLKSTLPERLVHPFSDESDLILTQSGIQFFRAVTTKPTAEIPRFNESLSMLLKRLETRQLR